MTERRRFNAGERAALYLAADGRCEKCGRELAAGWHADHVKPHAAGGPTLAAAGWVEDRGDRWVLTDRGRQLLEEVEQC